MFGQSSGQTGLFGKPANNIFGSPSTTSPFSPQTQQQQQASGGGLFGSTTQKPLFGQTAAASSGSLFAKTTPSFGAPTGTTTFSFGSSAQPGTSSLFGSGTQVSNALVPYTPNGTTVKFEPFISNDSMMKNGITTTIQTKHICVSSMKTYETKNPEELRVEDYVAGRKTASTTSATGLFTLTTGNTTTTPSIFGSQTAKPTGMFGIGAATTSSPFTPGTSGTGFGAQQSTTTNMFGNSGNTGNIFGSTSTGTNTPFGSTLQQQQQQQGMFTTAAGNTLTGGTKPIFGGTTTPAQSNIFGSSSVAPSFGQPGGTTAAPAFGSPFSQSAAGATSSIFGNTAQTKPASIFGSTPVTTNSLFPTPQPGPFGQTTGQGIFQQKPTGIFGAQQQPLGQGGIFGQQPQTTKPISMFGSGPTVPAFSGFSGGINPQGTFPNQQQPLFQAGVTASPAAPILLGTNHNSSAIQQAMIEAQLSALPYGDSPLLRSAPMSPPSGETRPDIDSAQRKLRFLASKGVIPNVLIPTQFDAFKESAPSEIATHLTTMSTATISNSTAGVETSAAGLVTTVGAQFDSTTLNYKRLVMLPSVGFGASLGLDTNMSQLPFYGPASRFKTQTFLSKPLMDGDSSMTATTRLDDGSTVLSGGFVSPTPVKPRAAHIKALDMSLLDNDKTNEQHSFNGSTTDVSNSSRQEDQDQSHHSAQQLLEELSNMNENRRQFAGRTPPPRHSSPATQSSSVDGHESFPAKHGIQISRPEYYSEPSGEVLSTECSSDGVCHIGAGLTIGRRGYGSVFWRGPFELPIDTNFDEIVHFRNKEVVVYPDEATKPEQGEGLNRTAIISLERIWPLNSDRQLIKDADELRRLSFRDKLERICQRMGATFRDYLPATGTWEFVVEHFSKYGLFEVDDDDEEFVVKSAAVKPTSFLPSKYACQEGDSVFAVTQSQTVLAIIREPSFTFTGLSSNVINSLGEHTSLAIRRKCFSHEAAAFPHHPYLISRRGVRVSFCDDRKITSLQPNSHMTAVLVSKLDGIVPTVQFYISKFLQSTNSSDRLDSVYSTALLSVNPPSLMLKLFDAFIIEKFGTNGKRKVSSDDLAAISDLCSVLLKPISSADEAAQQRIDMGHWLKKQLWPSKKWSAEHQLLSSPYRQQQQQQLEQQRQTISGACKNEPLFQTIFDCLVHGGVEEAAEMARDARFYTLSMLLSMWKASPSLILRQELIRQLMASTNGKRSSAIYHQDFLPYQSDSTNVTTYGYYEKILVLLSTVWAQDVSDGVSDDDFDGLNISAAVNALNQEKLNWQQLLGVIVWYWASAGTTLLDCIRLFERLQEKGVKTNNLAATDEEMYQ